MEEEEEDDDGEGGGTRGGLVFVQPGRTASWSTARPS